MRKARFGGLLASTALAGATILGGAGIASAQDDSPVTFDAEAGECSVTFTVTNTTNSDRYQIDYQINGEFDSEDATWAATKHDGLGQGTQTGDTRWGPASEASEDGERTTATDLVNLEEFDDLPEPNEDGSYVIEYRLIWGPERDYRSDSELSDAPEVQKVTVTGCEDDEDDEPGDSNPLDDLFGSAKGSADLFDLDSLRTNLSS